MPRSRKRAFAGRSRFQPEEDALLKKLVSAHGTHSWREIASLLPGRNARQCRDRWNYYLSEPVAVKPWGIADDKRLYRAVQAQGQAWDRISGLFPGRDESELQRRWAVLQQARHAPEHPTASRLPESIIQHAQDDDVPQEDTRASGAGFQFDDEFWGQVRRDNAINWPE